MKVTYKEVCFGLAALLVAVAVYAYQSDQERTRDDIVKLDKKYEKLEQKIEHLPKK